MPGYLRSRQPMKSRSSHRVDSKSSGRVRLLRSLIDALVKEARICFSVMGSMVEVSILSRPRGRAAAGCVVWGKVDGGRRRGWQAAAHKGPQFTGGTGLSAAGLGNADDLQT